MRLWTFHPSGLFCKRQQGTHILPEYFFRSFFSRFYLARKNIKRSIRCPCHCPAVLAIIFQCCVRRFFAAAGHKPSLNSAAADSIFAIDPLHLSNTSFSQYLVMGYNPFSSASILFLNSIDARDILFSRLLCHKK